MFNDPVKLPVGAAERSNPADGDLDAHSPANVATISTPSVPTSRRRWLQLSLAACGAALALGAVPAFALGQSDEEALRFLLQLEDIEYEFFNQAQRSSVAAGLSLRQQDILHLIADQDREHREWARMAIDKFGLLPLEINASSAGRQSHWANRYSFPADPFSHPDRFFPFVVRMKEWSVQAYHGLVQRSRRDDITQALASLAGIEGRHATALREASGMNPLPSPFQDEAHPADIASNLAPYGFRGEYLL